MSIKFLEPSHEDSNSRQPTHIAFTDESQYNVGRFGGLGMVSLRYSDLHSVVTDLTAILQASNLTEFKWNKLRSARERFAALKLVEFAVKKASTKNLRLDILTWDTHDSRHTVVNRDDIANLHRMYHHLFKNVMRERWSNDATWLLYPDEHTAMKWHEVDFHLGNVSHRLHATPNLFKPYSLVDLERVFNIREIKPCQSSQEPLIQLVDLFTGMAVYSRSEYEKYSVWQTTNDEQMSLLELIQPSVNELSRGEQEKCHVLNDFKKHCEVKKLGVSLQSSQGLRTFNPQNPINFWWYAPQHELDKAPTRQKQRS
ncbi:MAG: hypothetical protein J0L70_11085 [Leptolyngbya sp. UWPOB_LEPTO1]|uniref:DUF3800 domain-containing protein n=1 Tax=Leptolyngbya sp. UWPOB_LEPTO1 TaxID=2815653 RepID=UPI001AC94345|nr:DUF3800 domain-containing protein [Leptolyngbya sp. UWPOB_LEPTO1]MBN8561060.1 hypothetical protein [Leptolyngbya sp. UWPOB_LEPTO1]